MNQKKKVNTLFFRELDEREQLYIEKLRLRFGTAASKGAAHKALFGYLDLEENYKLLDNAHRRLKEELQAKEEELAQFRMQVGRYFEHLEEEQTLREAIMKKVNLDMDSNLHGQGTGRQREPKGNTGRNAVK